MSYALTDWNITDVGMVLSWKECREKWDKQKWKPTLTYPSSVIDMGARNCYSREGGSSHLYKEGRNRLKDDGIFKDYWILD